MNKWIKLIGSSDKPITEHPFYGRYKEDHIGFRRSGKPSIRKGDHLFIYAPGGSRRIFALAEAIANAEIDNNYDPTVEGSCRWRLRIKYLINVPVADGIFIDEIKTPDRNLMKSIQRQSHIRLSDNEYNIAYHKLSKKAGI